MASLLVHVDVKTAGVSKPTQKVVVVVVEVGGGALCACDQAFLFIQRSEEELYSSSCNLRKKPEVGGEPFLYDRHGSLQRGSLPRQHNPLLREFSASEKQRSAPRLECDDRVMTIEPLATFSFPIFRRMKERKINSKF